MFNADGAAIPIVQPPSNIENVVPYHRISGRRLLIPVGEPGHTSKQSPNGSFFWHELFRVKIPASEAVHGNVLTTLIRARMTSPVSIPGTRFCLIEARDWDSPVGNPMLNNSLATNLGGWFKVLTGTTTDTVTINHWLWPMNYDAPQRILNFGTPTNLGSRSYHLAPTPTIGSIAVPSAFNFNDATSSNDIEFVCIVVAVTDITQYRDITFDATIFATPPAPAAPTSLVGTINSPTSALLTWTDNATNETGYEVLRTSVSGRYPEVIATLPAGSTSYIDAGYPFNQFQIANSFTTGFYRVRAVNGPTKSALSNEVSVTPA
jgi:hypothetical protein